MKKNKAISFKNGPKIISICNQKGGVGKTTLTVNLAYTLANMGRDVLLIDFDSQASATAMLNVDTESEDFYGSVYELLHYDFDGNTFVDEWDENEDLTFSDLCKNCIIKPTYEEYEMQEQKNGKKKMIEVEKQFGFDLLPSKIELSDFDIEISVSKATNAFYLHNLIGRITNEYHSYDYILIDCNPSLGVMTINAIAAATSGVLITCNMSLLALRGIGQLTDRIVDVQYLLQDKIPHMGVIGIALNLFNPRGQVDKNIEVDANEFLPFTVFKSEIPKSVEAEKALYARKLFTQMLPKAEKAYQNLASEIEDKIVEMEKEGPKVVRMGEIDAFEEIEE